MGQSSRAVREATNGALDLVITNALIIDYWGIVKGDIGIKDGRIMKVGKAGNPDTMEGVDPELVIGASTEVIAGENMLVTAGGIDSHIHFIAPQQIYEAISNGITTMIGGGTGPATGTNATTCTPGAWNIARMLQAIESWPMNFGFLGKGNASASEPLAEQLRAGMLADNRTPVGSSLANVLREAVPWPRRTRQYLCWLHETSVRKNVDSLWITCAILMDTKLLRYSVSPNRLAIEQSAWRTVPLEPPLFAAHERSGTVSWDKGRVR